MSAHLDVNVASLLANHVEEPAQVGCGVQGQAPMGESTVGVLLVSRPVRRQRRACGCHYPHLSSESRQCHSAPGLKVLQDPQELRAVTRRCASECQL